MAHSEFTKDQSAKIIIVNGFLPHSLDPLDADITNNMKIARLIYATPFENTIDEKITSRVFESYNYDEVTHCLNARLREGLKFSNHLSIEIEDIVVTILRFAQHKRDFPVIKDILGIDEWYEAGASLENCPNGISYEEFSLKIQFKCPVKNPLYRLEMEIFSIIPRSAIDIKTGQLLEKNPPTSGYYSVKDWTHEKISLKKEYSPLPYHGIDSPSYIEYYICSESELQKFRTLHPDASILGEQSSLGQLLSKEPDSFQSISFSPDRFYYYLLNPAVEPFDKKRVRQTFSDEYYKIRYELSSFKENFQRSLFNETLPGFLPPERLKREPSRLNSKDFTGHLVPWAFSNPESNFNKAVVAIFKKLGITNKEVQVNDWMEVINKFAENDSFIAGSGMSFRPQDPVGDLNMFLSVGMHKIVQVLANNQKVRSYLQLISECKDDQKRKKHLEEFNFFIFDEAILNVFDQDGRMLLSPRNSKNKFPKIKPTNTNPPIWQLLHL